MIDKNSIYHLHNMFRSCGPVFIALGDEIRQGLILDIVEAGTEGINVSNLSARTNLSRPAISHHLKVLKDSGLIVPAKKGTQIFYQLNMNRNLEEIKELIKSIQDVLEKIDESKLENKEAAFSQIEDDN